MSAGTYRRRSTEGILIWHTERLWTLAATLPVQRVSLQEIHAFDEVRWFARNGNGPQPTCRAVTAHARKIFDADLTYPIILAADGDVMDGMHRIAKAHLSKMTDIIAVQFETDPSPDEIEAIPPVQHPFLLSLHRFLPGKHR